jgi:hypothetical protein
MMLVCVALIHPLQLTVWLNNYQFSQTVITRDTFTEYSFLVRMPVEKLKVFENRVLRRIFGPKRDEVTGGWRKLHNEELHGCTLRPVLLG